MTIAIELDDYTLHTWRPVRFCRLIAEQTSIWEEWIMRRLTVC